MIQLIQGLADTVGLPLDLFKTVLALLTSVFISPLYRVLPGRNARNVMSITIGFGLLYFMIEQWAFFILACIVLPYALFKITKRSFFVSAICSLIMLLIVHGYRFVTIYYVWKVDCSVTIMLLVTKLTYYGRWLEKNKTEDASFIDYLAYNLYAPTVVAGPTFSFEVYLNFLNNKFDTSFKTMNLKNALKPLLVSIPISCIAAVAVPYFHSRWVLQNSFYLQLNIISRILIMIIIGFFYRVKYYAAWYLGQGATNLSGLSLDANGDYTTVCAVSLKFQSELNVRTRTEHWNASMQLWLKDVVYESLKERLSEKTAFFGTFVVSAFWHGLYLTYYVGFIYWGILLHLNKWVYKWSQALPKLAASPIAKIAAFIIGSSYLAYIGMFLTILNWDDAVAFHAGVSYWGTITLIVFFALSFVLVPPRAKKQRKE